MSQSEEVSQQVTWFALYAFLLLSFYVFTSPFVGNPELLNKWTPYVYFSMGLYGWLASAAALHAPLDQLGLLHYTIKQPVSLLIPFFSTSVLILLILELMMMLFLPVIIKRIGLSWKLANVPWKRTFFSVLWNSAATSVACVVLILHCDASVGPSTKQETYNRQACENIFEFSNTNIKIPVPSSYKGALIIWSASMILAMTNFLLERVMGYRVFSQHWFVDRPEEEEDPIYERLPPEHALSMVPWYSMLLFDTAFELMISLKLFLGRFDRRTMQKALHPEEKAYIFDHLANKKDLWLDFMADCGDGFNSSYQIARVLAQPQLEVDWTEDFMETNPLKQKCTKRILPRGQALVIGGDLAYPRPEPQIYESRLWRVFEYAMKPPQHYDPSAISTGKPDLSNSKTLEEYEGPSCFAIPGNHDWFDGLNTFIRYVCHRDWLGGWLLPQKTSYFTLKLPHGWWLFGVDLALEDDINTDQYAHFRYVVDNHMKKDDRVIIVTHEPRWILDVYENKNPDKSEEKLAYLLRCVLKGRAVVRLAGDIHYYSRYSRIDKVELDTSSNDDTPPLQHSPLRGHTGSFGTEPLSPEKKSAPHQSKYHFPHMFEDDDVNVRKLHKDLQFPGPEHLIISGGGGAFLHPTHAPAVEFVKSSGSEYQEKNCYPPKHVSKRYALLNVFGFRRINWRFDIVGGIGYFGLVFSMFPRCSVRAIYSSPTWVQCFFCFLDELMQLYWELISQSTISLAFLLGWILSLILFADCTTFAKRCALGLTVSAIHCIAAFSVLILLECLTDAAIDRGAVGREGEYSLYTYFLSHLPDLSHLVEYDIFNITKLYAIWMKHSMTVFDVPEVAALNRIKICEAGFDELSRLETWAYYSSVFPYFWVLATPMVGLIFGAYLYVALNILGCHYNESFSALRISSYKNFLRMHFHPNGDLEILALGIDKMPQKWCRDPEWSGGSMKKDENQLPSYKWSKPSYWKPIVTKVDNMLRIDFENRSFDTHFNTGDRSNVHLIDRIIISKDSMK